MISNENLKQTSIRNTFYSFILKIQGSQLTHKTCCVAQNFKGILVRTLFQGEIFLHSSPKHLLKIYLVPLPPFPINVFPKPFPPPPLPSFL